MARHYATHTKLGQAMAAEGYSAHEVSRITGVNARVLTEYLAGRRPIPDHDLTRFMDLFDLPAHALLD